MNNDMLSQDEIDALLRGSDEDSLDSYNDKKLQSDPSLTVMEQDALGEIGNISFGSSATALSTLLNQKVEITTPHVTVISKHSLADEFQQPYAVIQVNYTKGFAGSNVLVIKLKDVAIIADLMLGGDGENPQELLGEIQLSAVQEAMNQMMGTAATSMSTVFNKKVDISPPSIELMNLAESDDVKTIPNHDYLAQVAFNLKIGQLIDSTIMLLLPLEFSKRLVHELLNSEETIGTSTDYKIEETVGQQSMLETESSRKQLHDQEHQVKQQKDQRYTNNFQKQTDSHNKAPLQEQQHIGHANHFPTGYQPQIQPADFSDFKQSTLTKEEPNNLDMLLDIPLQVTVELGRTKKSVKEILDLSSGSILELDKLAGEPVDILVNNKLVAKGEVVVIEENFGVRVTDILSQTDRIKKLR